MKQDNLLAVKDDDPFVQIKGIVPKILFTKMVPAQAIIISYAKRMLVPDRQGDHGLWWPRSPDYFSFPTSMIPNPWVARRIRGTLVWQE